MIAVGYLTVISFRSQTATYLSMYKAWTLNDETVQYT